MPAPRFLLCALALLSGTSANAQILSEDFNSGTLPPLFEVVGPSITFGGGVVSFNGLGDPTRTYLRTVSGNYFALGSFVAEVTLISPTSSVGTAFFGLGSGTQNPGFFSEPAGPTFHLRMSPNNIAGGSSSYSDGGTGFASNTTFGAAGSGVHRLRLTWDFIAQTAIFDVDVNYAGGAFVPDLTTSVVNAADNSFDSANAHLFFGGSGFNSFDDLRVVAAPEPGTVLAGVVALGILAAARRRPCPASPSV